MKLKESWKRQEDKEKYVSSYGIALTKREDIGN